MADTAATAADAVPMVFGVVLGHGDGSTPGVIIQPCDDTMYEQVAGRFLAAVGFHRLRWHEWRRRMWTPSPTSAVDVVRDDLVRVTTGRASIFLAEPVPTTPMWRSAARERRALVALVPARTFTAQVTVDDLEAGMGSAVGARRLVAALVPVRFDQMTAQRPS